MTNTWRAPPTPPSITEESKQPSTAADEKPPPNITVFLSLLKDLLGFFERSASSEDQKTAPIVAKYPKFLSKFALFSLQMDDSLFRQTVALQVLVFLQALGQPVGSEQTKFFKLDKDQRALADEVEAVALQLLSGGSAPSSKHLESHVLRKRSFRESVVRIVKGGEPSWVTWKEQRCSSFEKRPLNQKVAQRLKARREGK